MADFSKFKINNVSYNIKDTVARSQIGSPFKANTVSAMSDTTKIYVYTGSETGYTSGNWYYWDGSAWTSGGVYNSVVIDTDETLSVADMAADAEVVGKEIGSLKDGLLLGANVEELTNWQQQLYWKLDSDIMTVDAENPQYTANYNCLIAPCQPGDIFAYTGASSNAARKIAFLSSLSGEDNVVWKQANNTGFWVNRLREAPAGSAYVIAQANRNNKHAFYRVSGIRRILPNDALNDYLTPGTYVCVDYSDRSTITNLPDDFPSTGFVLDVKLETTSSIVSNDGVVKLSQTIRSSSTYARNIKIYYRSYASSTGFSDWILLHHGSSVLLDVNNLKAIQENDDLNDYVTPGSFFCNSANIAKTLTHSPLFVPSSFSMFVLNSKDSTSDGTYIRQILFANKYQTSSIYTRALNLTWGEWQLLTSGTMVDSPMIISESNYAPSVKLNTPVKRILRVATNNVAHYWRQGGSTRRYLSDYPIIINRWRCELMKMDADILFLQECEDYIDENRELSAFSTLYSPFFDSDTNVDNGEPPSEEDWTRRDHTSRRKILNRLGLNSNTDAVGHQIDVYPYDVMPGDENPSITHVWFNWCIVTITGVGNILLINAHNFAGSGESSILNRAKFLNVLKSFILQQSGVDYVIIAGDFNINSEEDKTNLLNFCSDANLRLQPSNGGMVGWFATHSVEEMERPFDNIIVSENIRFRKIDCDPLLVPSRIIHTDHTPVVVEIELF